MKQIRGSIVLVSQFFSTIYIGYYLHYNLSLSRIIDQSHYKISLSIICHRRNIFQAIKQKACLAANRFYHREVIITRQQQSALFNCRSFCTSVNITCGKGWIFRNWWSSSLQELSNNKRNSLAQKRFQVAVHGIAE